MLLVVLATLITSLGLLMYLPQTIRIVKYKNIQGVSLLGLVNSTISSTAWCVYLIGLGDWILTVATILPMVPLLVSLGMGLRLGGKVKPVVLPILWALVLVGAFLLGQGWFAGVLSLSIILFYGPAALHAWQAVDVSGISVMSWTVCMVEAFLSIGYGHLEGNKALTIYGTLATLGAMLVLLAVARDNYKTRRQVVIPAPFVHVSLPTQRTSDDVTVARAKATSDI